MHVIAYEMLSTWSIVQGMSDRFKSTDASAVELM